MACALIGFFLLIFLCFSKSFAFPEIHSNFLSFKVKNIRKRKKLLRHVYFPFFYKKTKKKQRAKPNQEVMYKNFSK